MLQRFQQRHWLKPRELQRTDSTHVLAVVRNVNRLELVGEALRAALNSLAEAAPKWLLTQVTPEWFERYSHRVEEYRLPKGEAARQAYAETSGADGLRLLHALALPTAPAGLSQLPLVGATLAPHLASLLLCQCHPGRDSLAKSRGLAAREFTRRFPL